MNCRTWMLSSWYVLANKRILTYMAVMISACVLFDSQLPVNGVPWPHLLHAAHPRTACCALNILLIKKLFDIYVLFFITNSLPISSQLNVSIFYKLCWVLSKVKLAGKYDNQGLTSEMVYTGLISRIVFLFFPLVLVFFILYVYEIVYNNIGIAYAIFLTSGMNCYFTW